VARPLHWVLRPIERAALAINILGLIGQRGLQ